MPLTQETRLLNVSTPLGENKLLLTAFRGREEMSRLFRFDLDFLSEDIGITPVSLVGKGIDFSVERTPGQRRHFNGVVSRFYQGDVSAYGRRRYRAEVVPWLWFLQRASNCRIFQALTAPEIIEAVFKRFGFTDFEMRLSATYTKRTYCVQYRETDFNFVSRLMEEEGIFYFFKHESGKHTLVLGDNAANYDTCEENDVDMPLTVGGYSVENHLIAWEHQFEFRSGKWCHQDYNFETPLTELITGSDSTLPLEGGSDFQYYDYPGCYSSSGEGQARTVVRMQEEETGYDIAHAASNCTTFTPGGKFKIGKHPNVEEEGKSFVITSIQHRANEPVAYETGAAPEEDYTNSFTCSPDTVVMRPRRLTPKPVMQGLQTAVVTGPSGEEIYTDKYGRIKVQFHWDRLGKFDADSSCWVRVAQTVAGKGWGFQSIPRIGQEVVINFLEGDPDQPIVIGSLYNAEQMPPWELPAGMNNTCIRSNTTKGGSGYNELMLGDTSNAQMFFLHAEKDMDVYVKNDFKQTILANEDRRTDANLTAEVKGNRSETVGGNHSEAIGGNYGFALGGDSGINIGGKQQTDVAGDVHQAVGGDRMEEVGGDQSLTVGKSMNEKVGMTWALEAGQTGHIKGGMNVVIEAGTTITLKAGGGFITIDATGVTIQGPMVKINSGGSAGSGPGSSPTKPQKPTKADPPKPKEAMQSKSGLASSTDVSARPGMAGARAATAEIGGTAAAGMAWQPSGG